MAWIHTVPPDEATGLLRTHYDAAVRRAGKVFGIVRTMSIAPRILDRSFGFYKSVMFATAGLERRQREMLAVVVSRTNDCHY